MLKIIMVVTISMSLANLYVFPDISEERKWLDCGDRSIPAEKTRFDHYGVAIYRSLSRDFLFIIDKDEGEIENCIWIGEEWGQEWKLSGFKKIRAGKYLQERILVFEIKDCCVSRYFNVDNGQEVFVDQTDEGEIFVDYQQETEEDPFEWPR